MVCPSGAPIPGAWTRKKSRPFIKRALELGINFFDTANAYSDGTSEEIVGRALRDFARREEIVIATKVFYPMRQDPNARGLSRKSILTEIDASLRRLGTDYVDLYQIHRWDKDTPIEETLEALHDVIKAGKARYIGASSMYAWQFAKALYLADLNGWTRFASMQNHYNLLNREEEREMMPLCAAEGIGVIPWSPLARGRLTRDWNETTKRMETDEFGKTLYVGTESCRSQDSRAGRGGCRQSVVCRARRSPWPGWRRSRSSPRRSSAPPSRIIWTMPSPPCRLISRLRRLLHWKSRTFRTGSPASPNEQSRPYFPMGSETEKLTLQETRPASDVADSRQFICGRLGPLSIEAFV